MLCDASEFVLSPSAMRFPATLSIRDLPHGFLPKYVHTSELSARNSCMSSLLEVSGMLLSCCNEFRPIKEKEEIDES